jgi:hypothetical protein
MSQIIEGTKSINVVCKASLLVDDRELAWAERTVRSDPAKGWVLGRYVEADQENSNRQMWKLDDLRAAQHSIHDSPLNLLHNPRAIVGHYVDTEMLHPLSPDTAAENHSFIEALAVFYKYYFPQEYAVVEAAHASGALWFSMECVSDSITCAGENGCQEEFKYAGPQSTSYCGHLNANESTKQLNRPHFLAGALIFPPERPGWKGAEVHDLSTLIKNNQELAERTYNSLVADAPHLDAKEWEATMCLILQMAAVGMESERDS